MKREHLMRPGQLLALVVVLGGMGGTMTPGADGAGGTGTDEISPSYAAYM